MSWLLFIISVLQLVWTTNSNPSSDIILDNFQNVYELSSDELIKYDQKGDSLYTYSSVSKGEIYHVDVSNPLRILVHFKENNEIVFLDNTLTVQRKELNFNKLGFYDVSLVCNSFQNNLWVYRSAEQKLVRLDQSGNQVAETPMLATFINEEVIDFSSMSETGNFLYLVAKSGAVYMFDHYGNYFKKILILSSSDLKFVGENAIYESANSILIHNLNFNAIDTLVHKSDLASGEALKDFSKSHIVTLNKQGKTSLYKLNSQR